MRLKLKEVWTLVLLGIFLLTACGTPPKESCELKLKCIVDGVAVISEDCDAAPRPEVSEARNEARAD